MKKIKLKNISQSNFWISYADLLAGLLFVFILVLGAIIVKYQYIQLEVEQSHKELEQKKNEITKQKEELEAKTNEIEVTKHKIENILGIKSEIILKIKNKLKDEVEVDPKSGALRLSGDILFDQGQSILRDEAKIILLSIIEKLNSLFVLDETFINNIDRIVIEGHTSSEGTYLYNLKLSQDRAFSVMQFFLEQKKVDLTHIRKYLVASGRSSSELIIDDKNIEDKIKSRRIEIKFRLRDDEAIKSIEKMLNGRK